MPYLLHTLMPLGAIQSRLWNALYTRPPTKNLTNHAGSTDTENTHQRRHGGPRTRARTDTEADFTCQSCFLGPCRRARGVVCYNNAFPCPPEQSRHPNVTSSTSPGIDTIHAAEVGITVFFLLRGRDVIRLATLGLGRLGRSRRCSLGRRCLGGGGRRRRGRRQWGWKYRPSARGRRRHRRHLRELHLAWVRRRRRVRFARAP